VIVEKSSRLTEEKPVIMAMRTSYNFGIKTKPYFCPHFLNTEKYLTLLADH
jgi:hypothetical protein